jgi:hypothetical protein
MKCEKTSELKKYAALRNLVNDGHVAFATMVIKDNAITPILLESTNSFNKEAFGNFLHAISPHVDAIIIISEAWTLMPDDVDAMALTIPVSQHPKRVEGVLVTAQSRCCELLLNKTFKRDAEEKPILDGEINEIWTGAPIRSTGNFSNLFGPSEVVFPPSPAQ